MPIGLHDDDKTFETVAFSDGIGTVMMSFNPSGYLYLANEDAIPGMELLRDRARAKVRLQDTKQAMNQYLMRSGHSVAQKLQEMHDEGATTRPASLFTYGELTRLTIAAHREWVANGGCSLVTDPVNGKMPSSTKTFYRGSMIMKKDFYETMES